MEPPSPHEGASSSTAGETLVAYEAPKMYEESCLCEQIWGSSILTRRAKEGRSSRMFNSGHNASCVMFSVCARVWISVCARVWR